jgi:hypothetical protein
LSWLISPPLHPSGLDFFPQLVEPLPAKIATLSGEVLSVDTCIECSTGHAGRSAEIAAIDRL